MDCDNCEGKMKYNPEEKSFECEFCNEKVEEIPVLKHHWNLDIY